MPLEGTSVVRTSAVTKKRRKKVKAPQGQLLSGVESVGEHPEQELGFVYRSQLVSHGATGHEQTLSRMNATHVQELKASNRTICALCAAMEETCSQHMHTSIKSHMYRCIFGDVCAYML